MKSRPGGSWAQAQLTGVGSPAAKLAGALDLYRSLDHRLGLGGSTHPTPATRPRRGCSRTRRGPAYRR
jgi:hypothetical protein